MRSSSGPSAPPAPPRPVGSLRSADLELQDITKRRKAGTAAVRNRALGAINSALAPKRTGGLRGTGGLSLSPTMRGPGMKNLLADPESMTTRNLAGIADTGATGVMAAQIGINLSDVQRRFGGVPRGIGGGLSGQLSRAEGFEKDRAKHLEEFIGKEMAQLDRARVSQARGRRENIQTRFNRQGLTGSLLGNTSRKLI